jgi:hypothetical protein
MRAIDRIDTDLVAPRRQRDQPRHLAGLDVGGLDVVQSTNAVGGEWGSGHAPDTAPGIAVGPGWSTVVERARPMVAPPLPGVHWRGAVMDAVREQLPTREEGRTNDAHDAHVADGP